MIKTKSLLERAKSHLPMGVADSYRYWGENSTVFVKSMKGPGFIDENDKEFTDFRLG